MDFQHSYEHGYKESRKALFEDQKAYMHGFARAYDEIEIFMSNTDCYESISKAVSPTLAKIDRELRENVINDLRDWLRKEWFEMAVSFIDEADGEDNFGKILQNWKLPEPLPEKKVQDEDWEDF
ncbi:MAG: hypothetical protein II811_03060 [Spirochaetaceae bacterium]|nr:hypothetical protein [Spirochaetaceae bacterium]